MIDIRLTKEVKKIINILETNGFEAYAVGGSIRDSLMGLTPKDWDITTSAKPDEIKNLFRNTIDTGIAHGTVTVRINKQSFEVTTYRIDGEYEDNRRPLSVEFTSNLEEDLKRRDFTINAMAYNDRCGLVDIYGGRRDIELGIIRCVGEAKVRFTEDALRTLRAVRFCARTGFRLHPDTADAIKETAYLLQNISAERIREELNYIITSDRPQSIMIAYELGMTKFVLPELDEMFATMQNNPHHFTDVGTHSIISMKYVSKLPILRWSMLLHDCGKPVVRTTDANGIDHFKTHAAKSVEVAKVILTRLKFDNDTIRRTLRLIKHHDDWLIQDKPFIRRFMSIMQEDMPLMFEVQRADIIAHTHNNMQKMLDNVEECRKLYEEILCDEDPTSLGQLDINGDDIINADIGKGKIVGYILNRLLDKVMDNPTLNVKDKLMSMAYSIKEEFDERS